MERPNTPPVFFFLEPTSGCARTACNSRRYACDRAALHQETKRVIITATITYTHRRCELQRYKCKRTNAVVYAAFSLRIGEALAEDGEEYSLQRVELSRFLLRERT